MKLYRVFPAAALLAALSASVSFADLYQWTDTDGVLHITSDMQGVPEEYRGRVKVFKSAPPQKREEGAPAAPRETQQAGPQEPEAKEELYGDRPLDWWKDAFRVKRQELKELQKDFDAKSQFVALMEAGMRVGQIYADREVQTYNTYKKELPEAEKRVRDLKDDINELVRKAKIVGVPKAIYGEPVE